MRKNRVRVYAIGMGIAELVGILAGLISKSGIEIYRNTIIKPLLAPPELLFPILWVILYALMGIGAAGIYLTNDSVWRRKGLNLFVAQLLINFFWPLIFFNAQAFEFSFFWLLLLWSLVLWMILEFRKVDRLSAYIQIPYLFWLTFAGYLNLGVWLLN